MKQRYLEITFRKGKPLAAYLYLSRKSGVRVARTLDAGHGVHVDFDEHNAPMGVEITAPGSLSIVELNTLLTQHGITALDADEWAPLAA